MLSYSTRTRNSKSEFANGVTAETFLEPFVIAKTLSIATKNAKKKTNDSTLTNALLKQMVNCKNWMMVNSTNSQ